MSDIWDTKDGRRRVRRDPPTVEEAVQAAQGLTEELSEQIEIVASLMDLSSRRGARRRAAPGAAQGRQPFHHRRPRRLAARRRGRTPHHAAPAAHRLDRALNARPHAQAPPATDSVVAAGVGDLAGRHQAVPDEQHHQRADHGGDQARALVRAVPADRLADQGSEEGADDAEHRGEDEARGLFGPGAKKRAMMPATKPMMMIQRMCMATLAMKSGA